QKSRGPKIIDSVFMGNILVDDRTVVTFLFDIFDPLIFRRERTANKLELRGGRAQAEELPFTTLIVDRGDRAQTDENVDQSTILEDQGAQQFLTVFAIGPLFDTRYFAFFPAPFVAHFTNFLTGLDDSRCTTSSANFD